MKRTYTIALCALALSLGACSDSNGRPGIGDPGPTGEIGDLGNGTFFYLCTDEADAVCDDGGSDYPVQLSFALDSTFGLSYRLSTGARLSVESSSPNRLRGSSSVLTAEKTGTVAVIASNGSQVTDMLHIHIAEMAEMQLEAEQASLGAGLAQDMLELTVGDSLELRATPHDEDGDMLAGAVATQWSSGDLSVVSFSGSDRDNKVELVAEKVGTAQIYVTMGELSRTVTVSVKSGPVKPGEQPTAEAWVDNVIMQGGGMGGAGGSGGAGGTGGQGGN